jgi:monooxygenase
MTDHFDVLIIGAGISGIGAACHLQREVPGKRVAILERRQAIGGTWDLFRYPGVRSDSDMFSFAYEFRPWMVPKVLAAGSLIREYVAQTAREYGVDNMIQFGMKITSAAWSSEQNLWTVGALHEASGQARTYTCNFMISCTGYYNYDKGYLPDFPGMASFKGLCIHPQFWPESLDYRGKKIVVIGSGATAVTIVPAMAADAAHVTMLQRSPTYYISLPGYGKLIGMLQKLLPRQRTYQLLRWFNIAMQRLVYKSAKRWPQMMRKILLRPVRKALGKDYDMRHFTPKYQPWDERLCMVPDGDLFKAIRSGKASVVTDQIDTFTEQGIRLKSGATLEADIVVTATGLQLQTFGDIALSVDGKAMPANSLLSYKAVLMQDVPNMAFIFGYTNASWTLKADIASRYICRLLNHMEVHGIASATPRAPEDEISDKNGDENVMSSLGSSYVRRAKDELPRQGRRAPWRVLHAFEQDRPMLVEDAIDDGLLELTSKRQPTTQSKTAEAIAA